jgi:hypothetical protein
MRQSVDAGILQMMMNALQRDADSGLVSRKEMLEELKKDIRPISSESMETSNSERDYPVCARIYERKETEEWVLEISGVLNNHAFIATHSQPIAGVPLQEVAGLLTLYERIDELEAELAETQKVEESVVQDLQSHDHVELKEKL